MDAPQTSRGSVLLFGSGRLKHRILVCLLTLSAIAATPAAMCACSIPRWRNKSSKQASIGRPAAVLMFPFAVLGLWQRISPDAEGLPRINRLFAFSARSGLNGWFIKKILRASRCRKLTQCFPVRLNDRLETAQNALVAKKSVASGHSRLPKHRGQIRHWRHRVGWQRQHVAIPILPQVA